MTPTPRVAQSAHSGIQELLQAENRASQIVAEARSGARDTRPWRALDAATPPPSLKPSHTARTERMKEAKREAEDVIKGVRAEKEKAFQATAVPVRGARAHPPPPLAARIHRAVRARLADGGQRRVCGAGPQDGAGARAAPVRTRRARVFFDVVNSSRP